LEFQEKDIRADGFGLFDDGYYNITFKIQPHPVCGLR